MIVFGTAGDGDGLVGFDQQDNLYAFGTRDNTLVLNHASLSQGYAMSRPNLLEITSAQVAARSWFRLHPESGDVFVTLDAQEADMLYVTPSLLRSKPDLSGWTNFSRADQRVSVDDFYNGRGTA